MNGFNNATATLMDTLGTAAQNTATSAVAVLPGLVAAIIVFIIGWIVAVIISRVFAGLLRAVRLEDFLKEHRVEDALGSVKISSVLVKILKYYILLIFLQAAVVFIQLSTISTFLTDVLIYIPRLVGAVLVALLAVILGEYLKEVILDLGQKSSMVRFAARGTKFVVVFLGIVMAFATMGYDTTLISSSFLVLLQALAYGLALAVGIAFGLGGQKDAQDIIGKWRKNLKI